MTIDRVDHTTLDVVQHLLKQPASRERGSNAGGFLSVFNPPSTASDRNDSRAVDSSASDARDEEAERDEAERERRDVRQPDSSGEPRGESSADRRRGTGEPEIDERLQSLVDANSTGGNSHNPSSGSEGHALALQESKAHDASSGNETGDETIAGATPSADANSNIGALDELGDEPAGETAEADGRRVTESQARTRSNPSQDEVGNSSGAADPEDGVPIAIYDTFHKPTTSRDGELGSQSRSLPPEELDSRHQKRLNELAGQEIPNRESTLPIEGGSRELDLTKPQPSQADPARLAQQRSKRRDASDSVKGRRGERLDIATQGKAEPANDVERGALGLAKQVTPSQSAGELPAGLNSTLGDVDFSADSRTATTADSGNAAVVGNAGTASSGLGTAFSVPEGALPSIRPIAGSGSGSRPSSESSQVGADRLRLTQSENRRLLQRVTRAFRIAQARDGEIRLRLSPPQLGAIKLEMKLNDSKMDARITTETESARAALIESLPALRDRLSEHGFQIESFEIELGEEAEQQESASERERRTQERSREEQSYEQDAEVGRGSDESESGAELGTQTNADGWPVSDDGINVVI